MKTQLTSLEEAHRWPSRGAGGYIVPPNKNAPPPYILVPKNTFTFVFDNTCDIGNFTAHIFCSQATQKLPKKHNEPGPPEQLPTDALSRINYKHTACANEQCKGNFAKSE